jgi:putative salt-induced outer membrane protein
VVFGVRLAPLPGRERVLLCGSGMRFRIFALLFTALPLFADDTTPAKPWSANIGAGLAITSGNTDTKSLNFSLATKYDPHTRLVFKADALYLRSESGGVTQVDKATADAREEYSLSERTFAFAELTYLRDRFKGISYLAAPLAGAGYRLIKSDRENLTVDGAAGAQFESDAGLGRSTSGAVKAGENFDFALSKTSKITEKLTGLWKTDDFGDALYHFDAGLSTTVTTRSELKIAYTYDYKTRPPFALKKGDSALFAALLFKF